MDVDSVLSFRYRAAKYLGQKGWAGSDAEDMLSEMVLYFLERTTECPGHFLKLSMVYLRALDVWNPRHRVGQSATHPDAMMWRHARVAGTKFIRLRESRLCVSWPLEWVQNLEASQAPAFTNLDTSVEILEWFRQRTPEEAALITAYYFKGQTMATIAQDEGVTEGRVSQRLTMIKKSLPRACPIASFAPARA